MFKKIIVIISLFIFSLAGFAKKTHEGEGGMPPVIVEVAKVLSLKQDQKITSTGSMRATQGIMVCPEVNGRITQIYFHAGDNVVAGTKLIQINPDIVQANYDQAKAELKLAQQDYERQANLFRTHVTAKADLDKAVATLHDKEAQIQGLAAQLRQLNIVAPFAGRVGLNMVNIGDYVKQGQNLVSLQAIDPIDVEFNVPEVFLSKIAVGHEVSLRSDAYPGRIFTGKVYAIDSLVNVNNRSILVRARVPNTDGKLLPGTFVETTMLVPAEKATLYVPQTAIVYDIGSTFVYKVAGNTVTGDRDQDNIAILDGAKRDDVVVTAGQIKLHDGANIIVKKN